MSSYAEKEGGWSSQYATPPNQPYGGYQQPPYQQGAHAPYSQGGAPYQQGAYAQAPYQQPPPQGYQQPPYPQNQYGAPPPPQGYGPPPQGYGAPASQGYQGYPGAPSPAPQGYPQQPSSQPAYPGQPQVEKRHSVVFKFSGTNKTILNSQVDDPYGKSPFSVSTPKKKVTTFRAVDGTVIAVIDWDHSSPVMEYRGNKIKIKEWLPLKKDDKSSRTFVHEGKHYDWNTRDQIVYLEPSDRPGHHVAIWRDPTGVAEVEVFQEALVIPGMLEACLLAVMLMQSGHSFGESSGGGGYPSIGIAIGTVIGSMIAS
ncbi:hypothetical protein EW146_g3375 [Bondarzewia mesenterica]|uniref:DUF6593 domain-containing protein n=1 Tax=Bondarzewia mesenterica TaxID=1095465 RepID=A0A4S4LXQ2_9AGAM|nr:hypothetical protein EW146_g3375 [Bondarzewia mesenterica]